MFMLLFVADTLAAVAAVAALGALLVSLRVGREMQRLRILAEQGLAGTRSEGDTTRERVATLGGAVDAGVERVRTALSREQGELRLALRDDVGRGFETTRTMLEAKLREMREGNEVKLAEIQKTVNEQLHAAVEKQMDESFKRVIDQFTAVQKAMGDVQAVTAQIGDIKRLFSNVKTRGGWGEAQVRAMLDDILPAGAYETNCKLRPDSDDAVEFAVRMPGRGGDRPLLPIDAKFPVQDYERLLAAADAGDIEAERAATRRLEATVRQQAKKIATKYINPPDTVEFAVMYLPTDALFVEVARIPGLIDEIQRECRVLVLGPSLFPALLKAIHVGFITLAIEQKADQVRELLGATRGEMQKMDKVLEGLARNAGTMSNTIEEARRRTRVVSRKLRDVEAIDAARAEQVLELEAEALAEET
jgi:DNA recombination protein RmuC